MAGGGASYLKNAVPPCMALPLIDPFLSTVWFWSPQRTWLGFAKSRGMERLN
jgi:hypothetical protein